MKRFVFIVLSIMAVELAAQNPVISWGIFNLQSYSGLIGVEGLYRNQTTILANGKTEEPVTNQFTGRILLNTDSYLWHPNFMGINLNLDYNPGVTNEAFLVTPDRAETRTAESLRLMLLLFKQRPLSFNLFYNLSHSFTNREYTSNVETLNRDYGANLSFRNKIVPVSIRYINSAWNQLEISSSRNYINLRESLQADFNKSFGFGDKHNLIYAYEDYRRKYTNADTISNFVNNVRLQNYIPFNKNRTSNLRSLINFHDQQGNQTYRRMQINENLLFQLPFNFDISGNYRFTNLEDIFQKTKQHNLLSKINHQLFSSLRSSAYYELIDIDNTFYDEQTRQAGFNLDYKKKIGFGTWNIGYNFRNRNDDRDGRSSTLIVTREEKVLLDGETILLDYPYVDLASVIVRDETGTIIYDENLDYILIERDNYVEIQRLPGGQIVNGQSVYIDYLVLQPISFSYNTNNHGIKTGFDLFNRLFQVYYRYNEQTYDNIRFIDPAILKTVYQNVYGLRITKYIFSFGAEYDLYQSNIVPYETKRYFATISEQLSNIYFVINANYLDRYLIKDREYQRFFDFSGQINLKIQRSGKISFYMGYRNQEGRGIDLDLRNFKIEYSGRYRSLHLSTGIEVYKRNYLGESISYNGAFIKLERRF